MNFSFLYPFSLQRAYDNVDLKFIRVPHLAQNQFCFFWRESKFLLQKWNKKKFVIINEATEIDDALYVSIDSLNIKLPCNNKTNC